MNLFIKFLKIVKVPGYFLDGMNSIPSILLNSAINTPLDPSAKILNFFYEFMKVNLWMSHEFKVSTLLIENLILEFHGDINQSPMM